MKKFLLLIFIVSGFSNAQEKYNHLVMPEKFEFQKYPNQHNVNTYIKSFFETEGFSVHLDTDKLPTELVKDSCKAMYLDLLVDKNMFITNVKVILKDCNNKILTESLPGTSREKLHEKSYRESLRIALLSLKSKLNTLKTPIRDEVVVTATNEKLTITTEVQEVENKNQLYAMPIDNGYKLVDSEPKVVFIIKTTSMKDVFLATKGDIQGTFLKKESQWYFDYYQDGKLISEKVSVKF